MKKNDINKPFFLYSRFFIAICTAALVFNVGCNNDDDNPAPNNNNNNINTQGTTSPDTAFMRKLALSNNAEIILGQLDTANGQFTDVKAFGQMMVSDHTASGTQFKQLATQKSFVPPADSALDARHQALRDLLIYTQPGYQWDSIYINSQVADHDSVMVLLNNEIASGQDNDVKNFATNLKPIIQMHRDSSAAIKNRHGF